MWWPVARVVASGACGGQWGQSYEQNTFLFNSSLCGDTTILLRRHGDPLAATRLPSCGDTTILLRRHDCPLAATRRSSCGCTSQNLRRALLWCRVWWPVATGWRGRSYTNPFYIAGWTRACGHHLPTNTKIVSILIANKQHRHMKIRR